MTEDTVNPIEDQFEVAVAESPQDEAPQEETQVPLSALKSERRKRQEMELEIKWMKEQQKANQAPPQEPDESQYESVTRGDLGKTESEILRKVEERHWIRNNPEKYESINNLLPEFLKRRPNLASAIQSSTNRYEEAWELMDKLSPREQKKLKEPVIKKQTPGSPLGVPKAASLDQTEDLWSMSDADFSKWKASRKAAR